MNLSLFFVEDDPRISDQLIVLTWLSLDARIVVVAETEHEALVQLRSHKGIWKLAVIDLFLKEGTGFGILLNIDDHPNDKVVVLTNSTTPENRLQCFSLGADAVFDKSPELKEFINYCSNLDSNLDRLQ